MAQIMKFNLPILFDAKSYFPTHHRKIYRLKFFMTVSDKFLSDFLPVKSSDLISHWEQLFNVLCEQCLT